MRADAPTDNSTRPGRAGIVPMVADMHEQSEIPALARFLNGEALASAEDAAQVERSVRMLPAEASAVGNGPRSPHRRFPWPWSRRRSVR